MSIFLGIVVMVVFRFASFDSVILLKTLGYDVALSIREAQSYSISVLGNNGTNFRDAYGISVSPDATEYVLFRDSSGDPVRGSAGASDVAVYQLGDSYIVSDVCIDVLNSSFDIETRCSADGIDRVDIGFRRPEYRALFYADGYSGSTYNIISSEIQLQSIDGENTASIVVLLSGQIKVEFAETTP